MTSFQTVHFKAFYPQFATISSKKYEIAIEKLIILHTFHLNRVAQLLLIYELTSCDSAPS